MRCLILPATLLAVLFYTQPASAQAERHVLQVDGRSRSYWLYQPSRLAIDREVPLVLVFHGGGGQGYGTQNFTHFNAIADREGFLVAYPDGLGRHWNDGRAIKRGSSDDVDDVAFVRAMLAEISRQHRIDSRRIFATGISNGAIFSHYLAARLSDQIAAIAPVAGGLAEDIARDFHPAQPVSVLIIQGTNDPLVPFGGGKITVGRGGGIVSTSEAVRKWVTADRCGPSPTRNEIPDRDPNDGCRAYEDSWRGGSNGTEVRLITIVGGGHTWPGGTQYLPKWIVGTVCRDFDASQEIWRFFVQHPKD